jgi:uncharacterized protein (DUF302 family)
MSYGMSVTLPLPYDEAVRRTREALSDQGFGVLTEIDVTATLKKKIDVDMEDYVILGACNPPLAHQGLEADRSLGLLLPCNVVVRSVGAEESVVEMLDPQVMMQVSEAAGLGPVAEQAAAKLRAALAALAEGVAAA